MGAIETRYGLGEAALLALDAGVDMLLVSQDRLRDGRSGSAVVLETVRHALADGRLRRQRVEQALGRIAELKARLAP